MDRDRRLRYPHILQDRWVLVPLTLVGDNRPRLLVWELNQLVARVLKCGLFGDTGFNPIFLLRFVLLSVWRKRPRLDIGNASLGTKADRKLAEVLFRVGTQNPYRSSG